MSTSARALFCELADVPRAERDRILAEREIPDDLCSEVASLLSHDSAEASSLTRRVSDLMEEALRSTPAPPSRCGPYRLLHLLGTGGMGAVYLAERHDGEIEQKVAVKLLRADAHRPAWRDRFLRERQLLAYLNHSSIARLLDAGHTEDGRPYLVMEYVDGVNIDEYAEPLDLRARLKLFLLVCEGVSHAHRHLIVHRDLKPSNILVDSSGNPKLLDFGIAKLLDLSTSQTRTVERLLTPDYASPEQLRGDVQTTGTDVYSLGAVLYRLLTGRSPREYFRDAGLPRDISYIVRKAMRDEPAERYISVDAFAADIRAFLEERPVQARSGDVSYRMRKFLRRHRGAVGAAAITVASLLLGLNLANHQRAVAQTRSVQVRQLATKVLALDETANGLTTSPKAMHDIVAMSKEYLEGLGAQAHKDHVLALEVVQAYSVLARAQGISMAADPGQRSQAEESLRKAGLFVEPILSANPTNRKAVLTAARISHDRMAIAENDQRDAEAVTHANKAVEHLDRLLGLGELSPAEAETVSELFYDIALSHKNLNLPEAGIRYAQRSIDSLQSSPNAELRRSLALSMHADLLRITGDLEGALSAIRKARTHLDKARFPGERERRFAWCRVLGREGKILGAGKINLNRSGEAIVVLERVFELLEEWTQNYPEDTWSRLLFTSVGRELGDTVRLRNPQRALAIYDHALLRLREVENNPEARRGEAEILSASGYALRRLNRPAEAKEKIDTALRILGEINEYPADRIVPHTSVYEAVLALGDHFSETGQSSRAIEVYEDLLRKITASDAQNNLRQAVAFSEIYASLAALYRRDGRPDRGGEFATLGLNLWRDWQHKLPQSSFVRRQLEVARNL